MPPELERQEGESWNEFVLRLEAFSDTQQLRVPKKQISPKSDVEVEIVGIYGVDAGGTPHELVGTNGFMKMDTFSATVMTVEGTFTKDAVGTTGAVGVIPASGDELMLMYGAVIIGAARATTTGDFQVDIANTGDDFLSRLFEVTGAVSADERFLPFPFLGTATASAAALPSSTDINQMRITGTDKLLITLLTMANTETFDFRLRLLSKNGVDPTLEATAGAIS
jgi:hypothetical protein